MKSCCPFRFDEILTLSFEYRYTFWAFSLLMGSIMSKLIHRRDILGAMGAGALGLMVGPWGTLTGCGDNPVDNKPKPKPPELTWPVLAAELVTITPSTAAFRWLTKEERATSVKYGTTFEMKQRLDLSTPVTKHHHLILKDLKPGTKYYYQFSTDEPESDHYSPGEFTTLTPPKGELLFRFGTLNDVHIGQEAAGGLRGGVFKQMTWPDPKNPHYLFTLQSAVAQLNQMQVDFVLIKGDIVHKRVKDQFTLARKELDKLKHPYYTIRGNHDRVDSGKPDYYMEFFKDKFAGSKLTHYGFTHKGVRFLCMDSVNLKSGKPEVSTEQLNWLKDQMKQYAGKPVMIFIHHPVTDAASENFSLKGDNRKAFLSALSGQDHLVGIFAGHSHRDKLTYQKELGKAPCVETAASLHYPTGFNVYEMYSDGYIQSCHALTGPNCLEWNEMTKQLYGGLGHKMLFETADKRNFVFQYKKS